MSSTNNFGEMNMREERLETEQRVEAISLAIEKVTLTILGLTAFGGLRQAGVS